MSTATAQELLEEAMVLRLDRLRANRDAALRLVDCTIEGCPVDGEPLSLAHVLYLYCEHGFGVARVAERVRPIVDRWARVRSAVVRSRTVEEVERISW